MNRFLRRNSPPGQNLSCEKNTLRLGLIAAMLFSLHFLVAFSEAYHDLFTYTRGEKLLKPGVMMLPFEKILGNSLLGFILLGICMLMFVFYHGYYFYQGSKSIYLVKRMPQRGLLFKYCLTLPILAFVVCMLSLILVRLLYFTVYLLVTPDLCLPPDAWHQFWRLLR